MHVVRRRRWLIAAGVAAVVATAVGVGVHALFRTVLRPAPACTVGTGDDALILSPDQAADAATIAAVAKRMGLPNHAVTVAIATALQESKLHNYPFGDRDSLGLFQQRPSQGWGRPAQLLTPAFAAEAFYRHLAQVPGWETAPVAEAAQAVQHSADGSAYAQWEEQARAMARALTGEVTSGMACKFDEVGAGRRAELLALADQELGPGVLHRTGGTAAQDWTVAEWIVGHAYSYGVTSVSVRGQRWTSESGKWSDAPTRQSPPSYVVAPPARSASPANG